MSVNVSPFRVAATPTLPPSIRAEGSLALVANRAGTRNAVKRMAESGPLRVRFPRMADADRLEAVLINTAGGIAGGDSLHYQIEAVENTSLAVTSQAAEKVYRSSGETAYIHVHLKAEDNSRLAWVPQETILFDRVRMKRRLTAEIAPSANVTICESVVFGRAAMGERVSDGAFEDCWRIKRGGKLVFADTTRLDGKIEDMLNVPAIGAGLPCLATVLHFASDSETRLEAVRTSLEDKEIEAGASAFQQMLVVRMIAADSFTLRRAIMEVLHALGAPPPRAFTL